MGELIEPRATWPGLRWGFSKSWRARATADISRQGTQVQLAPLDAANLSKPAGMAQGTTTTVTGGGMPLTVKQPELPIQKPARIFVIARPQEGGLPLSRPAPNQSSELSPSDETATTKE